MIKKFCVINAAAAVLVTGVAAASPAQAAPDKQYYLSVGDSYAVGYQPDGNLTHGFAQQLVPKARRDLRVPKVPRVLQDLQGVKPKEAGFTCLFFR